MALVVPLSSSAAGPVPVTFYGLGSRGEGVGRLPDGRVVFVHRTAPGDRALVRVTEDRSRWARGVLEELLEPGPDRRDPPCPYYDRCGGCVLEHLTYSAQLEAKGRMISDALARIGGEPVEPPPVRPSPREFRYRSRVSFTLVRDRQEGVRAGFHELDRPGRIVDLGGDCLLPVPEVSEAWETLRAAWGPGARRLPGGRRLRLTLRSVDGGVSLVVHGGEGEGEPDPLLRHAPSLVSLWKEEEDGEVRLLSGQEAPRATWMGETMKVPGTAFLQVNRAAAETLGSALLEGLEAPEGLEVVEGYAGVAPYGRVLARRGARVTAIELDPLAARAAVADAPPGLRVLEGRVEDRLEEALPADLVLLNPPRAGLEASVPDILLRTPPRRLVYVSCDQATLARDVERLGGGFRLVGLRAFDLFPQTAHVEVLATFEPG